MSTNQPKHPLSSQSSVEREHTDRLSIEALSGLTTRMADDESVDAVIADIADQADILIGHRLFTVMAFDSENRLVRRIFSSNASAYPPGGIKSKGESPWARQVLDAGKPFIGMNSDDIRQHFADHALIEELGLASVLNIPVRIAGRTLGTMNLLHSANFYNASHLELGRVLAGLLCTPLLLHQSFDQPSTQTVSHQ